MRISAESSLEARRRSDGGPAGARLHGGRAANFAAARIGVEAFVIGRHIFLSDRGAREVASRSAEGLALLAHELAHVEQYRRCGIARFLTRYFRDYVGARLRGRGHREAYAAISFEREARARETESPGAPVSLACGLPLSREGSPGGPPRGA